MKFNKNNRIIHKSKDLNYVYCRGYVAYTTDDEWYHISWYPTPSGAMICYGCMYEAKKIDKEYDREILES